jgi:catechol 2,3-dioxygenase-like lactoylglutathione lyase family enzyme
MLGDCESMATVGVKDLARARKFYEGVLGLKTTGAGEQGMAAYRTGTSTLFVYVSRFAGTNQATAVTWLVGDRIDAIVRDLGAKGAVFEHYDLPDTRREGDLHVCGNRRLAWLKDPDGNILGLANG